jgi:hypothetical protein
MSTLGQGRKVPSPQGRVSGGYGALAPSNRSDLAAIFPAAPEAASRLSPPGSAFSRVRPPLRGERE